MVYKMVDKSIVVCRRVGGLRKGSERRLEVLEEGIGRIGVKV